MSYSLIWILFCAHSVLSQGAYRIKSEHGRICVSECKPYDGYHWCHFQRSYITDRQNISIHRKDGGTWDHCTPEEGYDISKLATNGRVSAYGLPCLSECKWDEERKARKCDTDIFWHRKRWDWDWCSTEDGADYRGNKCRSKCEYKDSLYKWCNVEGGSWGYC